MKPSKNPLSRLACLILLGLGASSAKADYSAQVLAQSPAVYYRLNENVVVPPADVAVNKGSLGSAAPGYYTGTAAHPNPGATFGGGSSVFDGTASSVVAIPYNSAINPSGAFTVEGWFNPGVENPAGTLTCAISSGSFANPRSGWLIYQSDTGWNFRMYNLNGLAVSVSITGGPAPVAGAWHHVVAAYDGTTAKVYVNGVERASGNPTSYIPTSNGSMFIGGRSDGAFWWNGAADEVAVYSGALPAATILAHYENAVNNPASPTYEALVLASSPLAYYPLGEDPYVAGTSPVAANVGLLGADYNGAFNPGSSAQAVGPRPPAYSGLEAGNTAAGFNGVAGSVTTPYTLNDLTAMTVMGWVKRGVVHSGRGGLFGQNDLLEIGDAANGASIEFYVNAYAGSITIPNYFKDGEWGHLAFVGSETQGSVYTNGFLAATVNRVVAGFGASGFTFNIGGGGIFNATGDPFLGSIDEVAVFDKALTGAEVQAIYYSANVAPFINVQPVAPARTLVVGNVVTLSVGAAGTAPIRYQWKKGTDTLTGQTASTLVFNGITLADAGTYTVDVINDFGVATSLPVTLTVGAADSIAPTVTFGDAGTTFTTARIIFSEPLDPTTAQNPANYQITAGGIVLPVTSATLSAAAGTPGDNIVLLVTAAQTAGTTYTVTINNVKDQTSPGNAIAANSTVQFTALVNLVGALTFAHYDTLGGAADSDISNSLLDPRVIAKKPTTAGFLQGRFDTRTVFADDTHENYLGVISGWITPTETGDYYFFLRSDDASRLYLSTTSALPDPATATPIASEPGCCNPFYEPDAGDPATTAEPIHLVAGQSYGVLAYVKEAGGGDYLQVAWRKVGDETPAASLPYLPGEFLSTLVNPNVNLSFTTQPTDQAGALPSPVIEFVNKSFTADDGGFTVENTEPAPPGPWVYDPTGGVWTADGGVDGCGGPYNSRLTTPTFTVPATDEVTISFSHRYSFEADRWDGGQVWISVNGGAFTPVSPDAFTANGYPAGIIQGNGVLLNQRAFHEDSTGYATGAYITSAINLGAFNKNDTIALQFVGGWDDCAKGSYPSWVFKNLVMNYGTAPRATTFSALGAASRLGDPTTFTYQWQRNDGSGFTDIPAETGATFRIFPTSADFAATFRVVIKVPGKELASNGVKIAGTITPPDITIDTVAGVTKITYTGRLQSSTTVDGTYADVAGAVSPYTVTTTTANMFYRAVK